MMLAKISRDARPTTDPRSERHLAAAMGYPKTWRVVRKVYTFKDAPIIEDRIHAGNPELNVDMYFNHDAARRAASTWVEDESTGYEHEGGHLLKRVAKFNKKDAVEVYYEPEDEWYDATIIKRTSYDDDFRYSVLFTADEATQTNVSEAHIRPPSRTSTKRKHESSEENDQDEFQMAASLGLPEGWSAKPTSQSRWSICSPDGQRFRSKKAALQYAKGQEKNQVEDGDPPWRLTDHEYIGKKVRYVTTQKYSGTRIVQVAQEGKVVGWISETDVDKNGEPGFVSEATGKPSSLFHVVFDDDPNHPYANHLVDSQDFEEYELLDCLLPEDETPSPSKRKRSV